ncbi:hypothetical protein GRI97_08065 [Altererythrobacter xixiisoli]|uniref:Uncharacterized protein n=1 Tax=Croceibacterium xixiisoli TaxID=1476466 RepID=A0A6I4TUR9_9SPHN|nr:hypothetical protein [Croceibacterium xixiisoli]MXO98941.1 hypothetical protein [Croceibacterium xixiisoli]
MAIEQALSAWRHAPWGGTTGAEDIIWIGDDWSAAVFRMVIASDYGADPIITLTNQPEGQQGISAAYDPDMVHPTSGAIVGGTIIRPQIDKATLEALPDPTVESANIALVHMLYATPPGRPQRVVRSGSFTIRQGVPQE